MVNLTYSCYPMARWCVLGCGFGCLDVRLPHGCGRASNRCPLYRPRDPQASELWRLLAWAFRDLPGGLYRAFRGQVRLLATGCGPLNSGLPQVRGPPRRIRPGPLAPNCKHEMFVAYSCKQRCTCPSCHQKRTLLTGMHVAEDVCSGCTA